MDPTGILDARMDAFLARWAWVRRRNMEAFADGVARFFGVAPLPRIALHALQDLGIVVRREPLPAGLLAVWAPEDGRYIIRLSPFLAAPRANFTLWHEFFEMLAARPRFPTPPQPMERERLADHFAACVTMPKPALRAAALELNRHGDKSAVLAARFGVSSSAMRRRLRELGLPPFSVYGARVPHSV